MIMVNKNAFVSVLDDFSLYTYWYIIQTAVATSHRAITNQTFFGGTISCKAIIHRRQGLF
jgi:hypothetical protein